MITLGKECPFVKQLIVLCQPIETGEAVVRQGESGKDAHNQASNSHQIRDVGNCPVERDMLQAPTVAARGNITFTISVGMASDDPATAQFKATPDEIFTTMCHWYLAHRGSFAPRLSDQYGTVQTRRCCYIVQAGKKQPTSPRKLQLTCLLLDIFRLSSRSVMTPSCHP